MIKLRLTGLPSEIAALVEHLQDDPAIRVMDVSDPYADRGDSQYYRQYVKLELESEAWHAVDLAQPI